MSRDAILHVKLDNETDDKLRRLAAARGKSKAQLVRDTVSACFQTSSDELPLRQQRALSAFLGGYISLGKLAREMGMHVVPLREWLAERGLEQPTGYGDNDATHA